MDDWGILGLSIGTIANLGVAIATFVLVVYTYKSVKASEDLVTMNQREKERPIVLEFINSRLNPIEDDLKNDLQIIENNEINWYPDYPIQYRDYGNLVFPVSEKRNFRTNFSLSSFPFFLYSLKSFKQHSNLMSDKLKYRRGTYVLIDQKLDLIHKELAEHIFNELTKSAILTGLEITDFFSIKKESNPDSGDETFTSKMGIRTTHTGIPRQNLMDEVKSLIVIALFESHDNRDFRLSKKNYIIPTYEAIKTIKEEVDRLENQDIFHLKHEIENELCDLKNTDTIILKSISDIKQILQERYLFTDKEMNQFFLV